MRATLAGRRTRPRVHDVGGGASGGLAGRQGSRPQPGLMIRQERLDASLGLQLASGRAGRRPRDSRWCRLPVASVTPAGGFLRVGQRPGHGPTGGGEHARHRTTPVRKPSLATHERPGLGRRRHLQRTTQERATPLVLPPTHLATGDRMGASEGPLGEAVRLRSRCGTSQREPCVLQRVRSAHLWRSLRRLTHPSARFGADLQHL